MSKRRQEGSDPPGDLNIKSEEPTAVPAIGSVLRRARQHRGLSIREVERRTGKPNAYLSQVERGLIRQPDLLLLIELADLYGLNFETLAHWVHPSAIGGSEPPSDESLRSLIRLIVQLDANQRVRLLATVEDLLRQSRT